MKFRNGSLLNTHIYPYYKEEQSFYASLQKQINEHQKGINAMNNPNETLPTENLDQAADSSHDESNIPFVENIQATGAQTEHDDNDEDTDDCLVRYETTPENILPDAESDSLLPEANLQAPEVLQTPRQEQQAPVVSSNPYFTGPVEIGKFATSPSRPQMWTDDYFHNSSDGEFKPEFAAVAKNHSDDVSTQQDVAQASPQDENPLEVMQTNQAEEAKVDNNDLPSVPTWRQKLTNWFAPINAKFVAANPKINNAFSTFKTNALKLGKIFSGLLTAWFGLLLKASALLAFSSLIVMTPVAIVAAGIATMFLPVSIVLPLAAITFLIAPASVSLLGVFSAASAIALAAVGAAYVIKQRDIKTPESMVFHDEAALLNRIGGVFFQTIVGLVSKVPNTLVELPEHSRNAAGYVYDSLPAAPATVKQAGSKLYAAMPDVRGGMTSAFNTVKENVKYYTSASDVADKSDTAMRSGNSSAKQKI